MLSIVYCFILSFEFGNIVKLISFFNVLWFDDFVFFVFVQVFEDLYQFEKLRDSFLKYIQFQVYFLKVF